MTTALSVMHRIRRFLELPPARRRRMIAAWWWLLRFWVAVRVRSFRKVAAQAKVDLPESSVVSSGRTTGSEIDVDSWCVRAAARAHVLPMHCLERSLALQRMLRRQGIAAELQIGVEKVGDGIAAHAWLEVDGRSIVEPESISARFIPLVSH